MAALPLRSSEAKKTASGRSCHGSHSLCSIGGVENAQSSLGVKDATDVEGATDVEAASDMFHCSSVVIIMFMLVITAVSEMTFTYCAALLVPHGTAPMQLHGYEEATLL